MTNTKLYKHRDNCRLCHSTDVEKIIALQPIPLKTPNLGTGAGRADPQTLEDTLVPVDLYRCNTCGMLQLLDIVDSQLQYNDFRYRTSLSLGLTEHFSKMAQDLSQAYSLAPNSLVFEIGSNDGTLLNAFQDCGFHVLGIDPARDIAKEASAKGIPTIADFFNADMADKIQQHHGQAKLIISNNTFANLDELDDIIAGVKTMLAPDGVFVIETSYGADVIDKMLIDTVYHEHLSYFMVESLDTWFTSHGLDLIDAQQIWTKGGSLRLCVQSTGGPHAKQDSVDEMITAEKKRGLDTPEIYRSFSQTLSQARSDLGELVKDTKQNGGKVAAYGASVGTVTLLHQLGISTDIDFIADDAPLANSIKGPNYDIPICSPTRLYSDKPDVVIILAVRYSEPIMGKHQAFLDQGGVFSVPLPSLQVFKGINDD